MKTIMILLALNLGAFADDKQLPGPGGGGAADLLNSTKLPADMENDKTPSKVKFRATCTDSSGHIFKSTEKGYDECLATVKVREGRPDPAVYPGAAGSAGMGVTGKF